MAAEIPLAVKLRLKVTLRLLFEFTEDQLLRQLF
jgi:hypothetical protein